MYSRQAIGQLINFLNSPGARNTERGKEYEEKLREVLQLDQPDDLRREIEEALKPPPAPIPRV